MPNPRGVRNGRLVESLTREQALETCRRLHRSVEDLVALIGDERAALDSLEKEHCSLKQRAAKLHVQLDRREAESAASVRGVVGRFFASAQSAANAAASSVAASANAVAPQQAAQLRGMRVPPPPPAGTVSNATVRTGALTSSSGRPIVVDSSGGEEEAAGKGRQPSGRDKSVERKDAASRADARVPSRLLVRKRPSTVASSAPATRAATDSAQSQGSDAPLAEVLPGSVTGLADAFMNGGGSAAAAAMGGLIGGLRARLAAGLEPGADGGTTEEESVGEIEAGKVVPPPKYDPFAAPGGDSAPPLQQSSAAKSVSASRAAPEGVVGAKSPPAAHSGEAAGRRVAPVAFERMSVDATSPGSASRKDVKKNSPSKPTRRKVGSKHEVFSWLEDDSLDNVCEDISPRRKVASGGGSSSASAEASLRGGGGGGRPTGYGNSFSGQLDAAGRQRAFILDQEQELIYRQVDLAIDRAVVMSAGSVSRGGQASDKEGPQSRGGASEDGWRAAGVGQITPFTGEASEGGSSRQPIDRFSEALPDDQMDEDDEDIDDGESFTSSGASNEADDENVDAGADAGELDDDSIEWLTEDESMATTSDQGDAEDKEKGDGDRLSASPGFEEAGGVEGNETQTAEEGEQTEEADDDVDEETEETMEETQTTEASDASGTCGDLNVGVPGSGESIEVTAVVEVNEHLVTEAGKGRGLSGESRSASPAPTAQTKARHSAETHAEVLPLGAGEVSDLPDELERLKRMRKREAAVPCGVVAAVPIVAKSVTQERVDDLERSPLDKMTEQQGSVEKCEVLEVESAGTNKIMGMDEVHDALKWKFAAAHGDEGEVENSFGGQLGPLGGPEGNFDLASEVEEDADAENSLLPALSSTVADGRSVVVVRTIRHHHNATLEEVARRPIASSSSSAVIVETSRHLLLQGEVGRGSAPPPLLPAMTTSPSYQEPSVGNFGFSSAPLAAHQRPTVPQKAIVPGFISLPATPSRGTTAILQGQSTSGKNPPDPHRGVGHAASANASFARNSVVGASSVSDSRSSSEKSTGSAVVSSPRAVVVLSSSGGEETDSKGETFVEPAEASSPNELTPDGWIAAAQGPGNSENSRGLSAADSGDPAGGVGGAAARWLMKQLSGGLTWAQQSGGNGRPPTFTAVGRGARPTRSSASNGGRMPLMSPRKVNRARENVTPRAQRSAARLRLGMARFSDDERGHELVVDEDDDYCVEGEREIRPRARPSGTAQRKAAEIDPACSVSSVPADLRQGNVSPRQQKAATDGEGAEDRGSATDERTMLAESVNSGGSRSGSAKRMTTAADKQSKLNRLVVRATSVDPSTISLSWRLKKTSKRMPGVVLLPQSLKLADLDIQVVVRDVTMMASRDDLDAERRYHCKRERINVAQLKCGHRYHFEVRSTIAPETCIRCNAAEAAMVAARQQRQQAAAASTPSPSIVLPVIRDQLLPAVLPVDGCVIATSLFGTVTSSTCLERIRHIFPTVTPIPRVPPPSQVDPAPTRTDVTLPAAPQLNPLAPGAVLSPIPQLPCYPPTADPPSMIADQLQQQQSPWQERSAPLGIPPEWADSASRLGALLSESASLPSTGGMPTASSVKREDPANSAPLSLRLTAADGSPKERAIARGVVSEAHTEKSPAAGSPSNASSGSGMTGRTSGSTEEVLREQRPLVLRAAATISLQLPPKVEAEQQTSFRYPMTADAGEGVRKQGKRLEATILGNSQKAVLGTKIRDTGDDVIVERRRDVRLKQSASESESPTGGRTAAEQTRARTATGQRNSAGSRNEASMMGTSQDPITMTEVDRRYERNAEFAAAAARRVETAVRKAQRIQQKMLANETISTDMTATGATLDFSSVACAPPTATRVRQHRQATSGVEGPTGKPRLPRRPPLKPTATADAACTSAAGRGSASPNSPQQATSALDMTRRMVRATDLQRRLRAQSGNHGDVGRTGASYAPPVPPQPRIDTGGWGGPAAAFPPGYHMAPSMPASSPQLIFPGGGVPPRHGVSGHHSAVPPPYVFYPSPIAPGQHIPYVAPYSPFSSAPGSGKIGIPPDDPYQQQRRIQEPHQERSPLRAEQMRQRGHPRQPDRHLLRDQRRVDPSVDVASSMADDSEALVRGTADNSFAFRGSSGALEETNLSSNSGYIVESTDTTRNLREQHFFTKKQVGGSPGSPSGQKYHAGRQQRREDRRRDPAGRDARIEGRPPRDSSGSENGRFARPSDDRVASSTEMREPVGGGARQKEAGMFEMEVRVDDSDYKTFFFSEESDLELVATDFLKRRKLKEVFRRGLVEALSKQLLRGEKFKSIDIADLLLV